MWVHYNITNYNLVSNSIFCLDFIGLGPRGRVLNMKRLGWCIGCTVNHTQSSNYSPQLVKMFLHCPQGRYDYSTEMLSIANTFKAKHEERNGKNRSEQIGILQTFDKNTITQQKSRITNANEDSKMKNMWINGSKIILYFTEF